MSLGWLRKIAGGRRAQRVRRVPPTRSWLVGQRPGGAAPISALRNRGRRPSRLRAIAERVSAAAPGALTRLRALAAGARWPALPPRWRARLRWPAWANGERLGAALRVLVAAIASAVRGVVGLPAALRAPAAANAQLVAGQAPTIELPERGVDLILLGAVLGLLSIGSTIIYSATASSVAASGQGGSFILRQFVYASAGGCAMWVASRMDYRRLRSVTYPLLAFSLVLLFAALLFGARNGAHRWIGVGSLTFQPVELAKLALITYVAQSLARKADRVKTFTVGFVPHLVVCGAMMVLLLKQPDLGSSVVLGATTLAMLFVAGARISYLVLAILATAPVAYHLVVGTPWRMQRVLAYFNPEAYAQTEAYQFLQARLAIGSGGLTGVGLGRGNQTLGYLPEAHNDFIAAPIGEELGFVGVAVVLILFAVLLWRGLRAAVGARDAFGSYLAFGITFLLGAQALFNLGVVFGVIPNKGITLPLVSYGGTSLIVTMFLVGLLLNVGRRPHWKQAPRALVNTTRKKRQRVRVALA